MTNRQFDEVHPETKQVGPDYTAEAITTRQRSQWSIVLRRFVHHKVAVVGLVVLVGICCFAFIGPLLWPWGHTIYRELPSYGTPSVAHPFGIDRSGRDMFGTTMKATQQSLKVAFFVAFGATIIGSVWGAVAGFYRGILDGVLMRVVDVLFVIPFLAIVAAVGYNVRGGTSWLTMALILTLFSWLGTARAVRAEVLSLREREFVEAAKAAGASDLRIIFRHILPNTMSVIIVSATLQIAFAILAETTLSFLGLGIQPPDSSLGLLIQRAQSSAFTDNWYLFYIPGAFVILITLTVNFIGDGIRDAMDPRQTMVRR